MFSSPHEERGAKPALAARALVDGDGAAGVVDIELAALGAELRQVGGLLAAADDVKLGARLDQPRADIGDMVQHEVYFGAGQLQRPILDGGGGADGNAAAIDIFGKEPLDGRISSPDPWFGTAQPRPDPSRGRPQQPEWSAVGERNPSSSAYAECTDWPIHLAGIGLRAG
jgi:hypothetical protein